jgi:hypothetical protein
MQMYKESENKNKAGFICFAVNLFLHGFVNTEVGKAAFNLAVVNLYKQGILVGLCSQTGA